MTDQPILKQKKDFPAGVKIEGVISMRNVSKTPGDPSKVHSDQERCLRLCQRALKVRTW